MFANPRASAPPAGPNTVVAMRKLMFRTGTVITALATAFALQAAVAPAAQAAEHCSQPVVYGTYALRACVINSVEGHVLGFAHVSLKAGHSPCVVRGRLASTAGWISDPAFEHDCPLDVEISFKTPPLPYPAIGYLVGTYYYSAFSVLRKAEPHDGAKTTSPTLTAYNP